MDRSSRTSKVVNLIYLDEERLTDIMEEELESGLQMKQMKVSKRGSASRECYHEFQWGDYPHKWLHVPKSNTLHAFATISRRRRQRWQPIKPAPPHTIMRFLPDITLCWVPKAGATLIARKNLEGVTPLFGLLLIIKAVNPWNRLGPGCL